MRFFDLPTALLGLLALNLPSPIEATQHTSNWAVLVSTSRFWFNYRHMANTLSLYRTVKRLGIPDSQIILMLPDDMACNPRNTFAGSVFNDKSRDLDLYDQQKSSSGSERPDVAGMGGIEVDYRGNEVTVESFIRLLTDRWPASHPTSKRLMTDDRANILIYMTGHGGDSFLKFQDAEEISSHDLADAFEQMYEKKRYHEMLFMIDTCQANTMYTEVYSPGVIATGSSALDQSSYSHHADQDVGVAVIDRWTYFNLEFLETRLNSTSSDVRLGELFDSYTFERVHSDAGVRYDLFPGGEEAARNRRVLDFFGNVQGVDVETGASGAEGLGDWKADLEALRKITERSLEEMRLGNGTETGVETKPANEHTAEGTLLAGGKVGTERVAVDMAGSGSSGWAKKVLGAGSLLALGAAWVVGSRLK
ncbi:glycosylphosphatidylinositol anchor biosynthesis [Oleoguttula mirabilis]|uniref:Glycosylphosphatidylinositol anchor biosynthesis n=1 Tax=Oleoguttula mirabilis TaxID=1507867 RepID=A0AAV9JAG4_9PEZI|nr:glycosylphosphatidylinositol anchor biosynthesis [Oleoguttula mirabilis]